MNAKQKLHQAYLNEWAARFVDQKSSGLTVPEWCEKNHFSIHSYYYWKRMLKERVVDQTLPDIVPLSIPVTQVHPNGSSSHELTGATCTTRTTCASVRLAFGDISIEVSPDIPEHFLFTLIKAVRYA